MDFLKVVGVGKKDEKGWILSDTSFTQQQFQKIAIAGETGSGKSTLLKIIAGMITPDTGRVFFENKPVKKVPVEQLIPGHPGIAYLSQHFELRNNYRVEELLEYANNLSRAGAGTLYEVCRISHLLKRKTDQLSGGEKQRIALARLLSGSPRLLLLDEPFSNLDMIHKNLLKSVIQDIGDTLNITCMMVSHDPQDTLSWADDLFVMKEGVIIRKGSPAAVYFQPHDLYTAGLFGTYNIIAPATAALFRGLTAMATNGENKIVRPEQFTIRKEEGPGVAGTILKVVFFGAYYEIEVAISSASILVRTQEAHFEKGDEVHVTIK